MLKSIKPELQEARHRVKESLDQTKYSPFMPVGCYVDLHQDIGGALDHMYRPVYRQVTNANASQGRSPSGARPFK